VSWRPEDEALLGRLEDEELLDRMFRHHAGPAATRVAVHPRAAGLFALVRTLPGGAEAVRAGLSGDVASLVRFVEAAPMAARPPELLHHLALYFGKVASALSPFAPDAAANAWTRALAAWLALSEERSYLTRLEAAVLGSDANANASANAVKKSPRADVSIPPERVPLEILADLGRRAEASSRDLALPGRAALLALAWVPDAARLAGASEETLVRARTAAERRRNAALDAALAVIAEAFDDANVRGTLVRDARGVLLRANDVWVWSGHDELVEEFVVDRITTVGWEMYRARQWDVLRSLLEPFVPMVESLAARIEKDPSKLAYAAPCAQMYVFRSDVERAAPVKLQLAERAVHICPTHRNGRLVLASILCDEAQTSLRTMVLFARRDQLDRVEALVARAEKLYPQLRDLPEAKAMLDRVKRGRISV
jgi:hypothetical protein